MDYGLFELRMEKPIINNCHFDSPPLAGVEKSHEISRLALAARDDK